MYKPPKYQTALKKAHTEDQVLSHSVSVKHLGKANSQRQVDAGCLGPELGVRVIALVKIVLLVAELAETRLKNSSYNSMDPLPMLPCIFKMNGLYKRNYPHRTFKNTLLVSFSMRAIHARTCSPASFHCEIREIFSCKNPDSLG